ncbi:PAS domain-containing protein [Falsiroseomonas sp.]|uniref:PAS domain-containing protein n=1 Tax=Falsiroseomonas sp. TaxID=2870721 RepID=UPI003F6E4AD4
MVKVNGALPIGLAALLRLVALAAFATLSALGSYRASDEASLRDTARALAAAADAKLGAYVAALETLATSPLLDGDLDPEAFEARARPVGALLGGTIALLGPGPEYAVLVTTGRRPNSPLSDALQMALSATIGAGEPGISDLFEGPAVPRPLLAAAVPVDRVGQPRRGLALTFEPATLHALLARQTFSSGTFAAVADGQMRILAHSADPGGRLVGVPAPEWVAPGWSGPDNVYAVERLTRAPDWAVGVYERRAAQQASAWAALRWLIAGGAVLGLGLAVVVWASRREAVRDARREAEAMRAGRAEAERLLGGLPAAIFLREVAADGSSRLVYRGGNLETVMGWPTAELATRQNLEGLIHPEDTTLTRQMPQLLREGQVSYEWRMRQPAGGWRLADAAYPSPGVGAAARRRRRDRWLHRRCDGTAPGGEPGRGSPARTGANASIRTRRRIPWSGVAGRELLPFVHQPGDREDDRLADGPGKRAWPIVTALRA